MTDYAEGDWYEDAPGLYDLIFDAGTEDECAFLEGVHARHGAGPLRRVLEPACGSGRLVEALARRGYDVTGFDISDGMLEFARKRLMREGLEARVEKAQMQDFSCGTGYDVAHNFVSTFKYLLHEKDARAHLQQVAESLRPGGLYILGFHLSDYSCTRRSRERWVAQRGRMRVTCNIQSWPAERKTRLERVRSRLQVQEGRSTRKLETSWWFRTYDAAQVRSMLRAVPAFEHLATYDFCYDLARGRRLSDEQLDTVFVLRRVGAATAP